MNRREFLTGAAAVAGMGATGLGTSARHSLRHRGARVDAADAAAGAGAAVPGQRDCRRSWRGSRS